MHRPAWQKLVRPLIFLALAGCVAYKPVTQLPPALEVATVAFPYPEPSVKPPPPYEAGASAYSEFLTLICHARYEMEMQRPAAAAQLLTEASEKLQNSHIQPSVPQEAMSIRFRKNSQIYALCIPLNKKGEAGYRSAKKRALQALRTDAEQLSDIQLIHFNPAFVPSSVEEIIVRSVKALGEDGASSTAITKLEPLLWGVDVYGLAPPPQRSAQLYVGIAEYFITEGKEDLAYIALKNAGRAAAQWAAAQSENSPRIHTLSEKIAHLQAMLARQAHTQ